ncbi:MAG: alpha/beta hydrolase [Candidatus Hadarchaeum sp.]
MERQRLLDFGFFPKASYAPPAYAHPESFIEEEILVGAEGWALPATLTVPKGNGPFPAVVLVHGSGPHDRDETIGPNKPFKDLAWGLATRGIAVLRYEKRTKQYPIKCAEMIESFTVEDETIADALAAVEALRRDKRIDQERIFVLGHSLGGMLAPRIGVRDGKLSGLILLAANARNLTDLILEQVQYLATLDGKIDDAEAKQIKETENMVKKIKELDIASGEVVLGASRAYWEDLMTYDPLKIARELSLPMLILQGGRDYQVTLDDFNQWKECLSDRESVTFKLYDNLNHLFISGRGVPSPAEYQLAGNVDQTVVEDIAEWIKSH